MDDVLYWMLIFILNANGYAISHYEQSFEYRAMFFNMYIGHCWYHAKENKAKKMTSSLQNQYK